MSKNVKNVESVVQVFTCPLWNC